MRTKCTRRKFIGSAALGGLGFTILKDSRSVYGAPANERLNLAIIGCGGRGRSFAQVEGCCAQGSSDKVRVAFLCDVNEHRAAAAFNDFPDALKGNDYRKMFDKHAKDIDAVIVATGDYGHAPASSAAIRAGKPVYCEKPLTVAVHEARMLAKRASENKVVTQMGNQNGYNRKAVNAVWAGMIGEVREAHAWCASAGPGRRPLPSGRHAIPSTLKWDLWLGPAPYRDYHPSWLSSHLMWREFGTSMLGNRGSHSMATLFKSLKIGELWKAPADKPHPIVKVTGQCDQLCLYSLPKKENITWQVPEREGMPPLKVYWYGGSPEEARPRLEELSGTKLNFGGPGEEWKSWLGSLIVGEKRTIICGGYAELSGDKLEDIEPPDLLPKTIGDPGLGGLYSAVRGGLEPMSSFDGFSGPYTEFQMLAHVSTMFPGEELEFDTIDCKITNNSLADLALRREYRQGWTL